MSKRKWETNLHEARELKKQGAALLFDRVTLLVAVYEDAGFRAWCADSDTVDLDYLDEELSDTAANFLTLKAVLDTYTTQDEWVTHNIRDLIAQVISDQAGEKKVRQNPEPTWKERAIAAEKKIELLLAKIEQLEESLQIVAGAHRAN